MDTAQIASKTKISAEEKQNRIAPEKADGWRRDPKINFANPNLMRAKVVDGKVIVPVGWRDDDDDE